MQTHISGGDVDRDERHPRFPGVPMERYHPRAGMAAICIALPAWAVFLINGMLGFFPAVIFAEGGIGSKFHFWLFLKDRFFGGSPDPVWSEAGVLTIQEWLLLAFALPSTLAALYCLRRRPEFGAIEKADLHSDRESLEMATGFTSTAGTGDANTAAIIDSVLGEEAVIDQGAVSAALGEMGALAATVELTEAPRAGVAVEIASDSVELEPTHDSRFTTTIPDEETLAIAAAAAAEDPQPKDEDDWAVWEPEIEAPAPAEPEPEPAAEPVSRTPSIPTLPSMEKPRQALSDITSRISGAASKAAEATVSAAKEVTTKTVEITEKVVEKVAEVRPSKPEKPAASVMPVRPQGLPPMAEWNPDVGEWVLLGRPIRMAPEPEPEAEKPAWAREEAVVEEIPEVAAVVDPAPATAPETTSARRTPVIPKLP